MVEFDDRNHARSFQLAKTRAHQLGLMLIKIIKHSWMKLGKLGRRREEKIVEEKESEWRKQERLILLLVEFKLETYLSEQWETSQLGFSTNLVCLWKSDPVCVARELSVTGCVANRSQPQQHFQALKFTNLQPGESGKSPGGGESR